MNFDFSSTRGKYFYSCMKASHEGQIEKGLYVSFSKADQHTVADAIRRYRREILPLKTNDVENVARHLNRSFTINVFP